VHTKTQIKQLEQKLRAAMLSSDLEVLDELLAPELIFTNHLGYILTKQDDLSAHESGTLKIDVINSSEENIIVLAEVAIVTVKVQLIGSYAGVQSDANFRFSRVWALTSSPKWHVIVAHSSIIQPS